MDLMDMAGGMMDPEKMPSRALYQQALLDAPGGRIAAGSGTTIQDVNRLLKQHKDMQSMFKRAKKMGKKGLIPNNLKGLMPSGFPPQ